MDPPATELSVLARESVAGGLPDGWHVHVDPDSGVPFYTHSASGETRWSKPEGTGAPEDIVEVDSEDEDKDEQTPSDVDVSSDVLRSHGIAASSSTSASTSLSRASFSNGLRRHHPLLRAVLWLSLAAVALFVFFSRDTVLGGDAAGSCAQEGRDSACSIHSTSLAVVLAVLLASFANVLFDSAMPAPPLLASVSLLALSLLVIQMAVTVETPSSASVAAPQLDFGRCSYVDETSHIVLEGAANTDSIDSLLSTCRLSNVYVRLPTAWLQDLTPGTTLQPECPGSSWNLYEVSLAEVPVTVTSLFQLLGVIILQDVGKSFWPRTFTSLTSAQQQTMADQTVEAVTRLFCEIALPVCSPTCVVPTEIPKEACGFLRDRLVTPVTPPEFANLNAFLADADPASGDTPAWVSVIAPLGLSPATLLGFLVAGNACLDGQTAQRAAASGSAFQCLPNNVSASVEIVAANASGTFYVPPPHTAVNVTFQFSQTNANVTEGTGGQCDPANRAAVLSQRGRATLSAVDSTIKDMGDASLVVVGVAIPLVILLLGVVYPRVGPRLGLQPLKASVKRAKSRVDCAQWWSAMGYSSVLVSALQVLQACLSLSIAFNQSFWLFALVFHSIGCLSLAVAVKWPFWFTHYVQWRRVDHVGPITRLRKWLGIHRFSYGQPDHLRLVIVMEFVECVTQIFNLVDLKGSVDIVPIVALSSLVGLNLIITPLLFLLVTQNLALGLTILDTGLDFAYIFVTLVVRDVSNIGIDTALVLAVPLVTGITRGTGVSAVTTGKRFQIIVTGKLPEEESANAKSAEMSRVDSETVARRVSIVRRHNQTANSGWRPRRSAVLMAAVICVSIGTALLLSTIIRAAMQDQICRDEVTDAIWSASSPKALFPSGILSATRCCYECVASLEVHSKSVDTVAFTSVIARYREVQTLDLSGCAVGEVPASVTALSQLTSLQLADNRITFVAPEVFSWAPLALRGAFVLDRNPVLFALSWDGLGLTSLPLYFRSHLSTTLVNLSITGHAMTVVPMAELASLQVLERVSMSHGTLSEWPTSGAYIFNNLREFDVSFNRLRTVESSAFTAVRVIRPERLSLNFAFNRINQIFSNMASFGGQLNLTGNSDMVFTHGVTPMDYLNPEVFRVVDLEGTLYLKGALLADDDFTPDVVEALLMQPIERVDLTNNLLTHIPEFINNTAMEYLWIGKNAISSLANSSRLRLNLGELILGDNSIAEVPAGVLAGSNITSLTLNDNGITAIADGAFSSMVSLRALRLDNNPGLNPLRRAWFSGIPELRALDLTGLGLASTSDALCDLKELEVLSLQNNLIPALDARLWCNATTLTELVLPENQIASWADYELSNLTGLRSLTMYGPLPEGYFRFNTQLRLVDVAGCGLSVVQPSMLSGLTQLERLEMAVNDIRELPVALFHDVTRLSFLRLSGNPLTALPRDIFAPLAALATMHLGSTLLEPRTLPEGLFDPLVGLIHITVPPSIFNNVSALGPVLQNRISEGKLEVSQ